MRYTDNISPGGLLVEYINWAETSYSKEFTSLEGVGQVVKKPSHSSGIGYEKGCQDM